jgi:hypothetical protein
MKSIAITLAAILAASNAVSLEATASNNTVSLESAARRHTILEWEVKGEMDTDKDGFVTYQDVYLFFYKLWPTWWPDIETRCAEENCDNFNYQTLKYNEEVLTNWMRVCDGDEDKQFPIAHVIEWFVWYDYDTWVRHNGRFLN